MLSRSLTCLAQLCCTERVVDDHDQEHEEEKPEDTGTLLNFCTVYSQLLQTHLALEELITGQHQSSQEQGETSREEQEEQVRSVLFYSVQLLSLPLIDIKLK